MNIFALLATVTLPAGAPVDLKGCSFENNRGLASMSCQVTNKSDEAVASIDYHVTLSDSARSVPWASSRHIMSRRISGGVEPGETLEVFFPLPDIPNRAKDESLVIDVTEMKVIGIAEKVIWSSQ